MSQRTSSPRPLEPSAEGVTALRMRLERLGFLIREETARDVLRAVLLEEAAHLDRHAREAAADCLRSIQSAAREALDILTQGPAMPPGKSLPPTVPIPGARAAPGPRPPSPAPAPAPAQPSASSAALRREESVNHAEVVRRRIGEELPPDSRPVRTDDPTPVPPRAPVNLGPEARRPVFKHPRKR
jgi:hypothetical protein